MRILLLSVAFAAAVAIYADAQQEAGCAASQSESAMQNMPGMEAHSHEMRMESDSLIGQMEQHDSSGTGAQPNSTASDMIMTTARGWTLMFHGQAFLNEVQQSGARGKDKLFSTNWIMPMAQRNLGHGILTLRTMLSFEPGTVSRRQYPELFQQGETAFGNPIVDGHHPHDFFMELAILYDHRLGEKTLLSFYFAPMGDPSLGPVAYPHRKSASENPVAALGHHLQDSTHIADDVVTVGLTHRAVRIEASGFHGREPDEFRWDLDSGKIDSWSTRLTVAPARAWSVQYSIGQLHSPEALASGEDLRRMTASVMYNRPLNRGNWASTLLWGRNRSLTDGNIGNGYLAESTLQFRNRNFVWTRIEDVDRTTELLVGERPLPAGFQERYFTRVQAYTFGYDREIGNIPHLATAIGGQVTTYAVPDLLQHLYGSHPNAFSLFLRVRAR